MSHGHAVIEHEAVALPATLRLRHLLQILEDAALEVINLLKALTKHIARRLLAANAAGAKHCDLLMLCRVVVSLDVVRKVSERFGLRVDRTFERTDCHFVVVTGVDQQHFRIGDQRVPVLRLDIGSNLPIRIDTLNAERDDLLLQLDLGAIERLLVAVRFLVVDVGKAVIEPKPFKQRIDGLAGTGDRAVDTLLGQQQGALDAIVREGFEQGFAQRNVIRQRYELVQRCHNDFSCHGYFRQWSPA